MPATEAPIAFVCHGLAAYNSKAASPKALENPSHAEEEQKPQFLAKGRAPMSHHICCVRGQFDKERQRYGCLKGLQRPMACK